jgi:hypothetical protein
MCARVHVHLCAQVHIPLCTRAHNSLLYTTLLTTLSIMPLYDTRVVTQDVTPSLNVYYKNTRIKQYHKESRALRAETTKPRSAQGSVLGRGFPCFFAKLITMNV